MTNVSRASHCFSPCRQQVCFVFNEPSSVLKIQLAHHLLIVVPLVGRQPADQELIGFIHV